MEDLSTPDKPNPPNPRKNMKKVEEMNEGKKDAGEYKFNLGMYRIQRLDEIMNVCTKRYHKAILKKEDRHIEKYQAIVNTFFVEVYTYMEEETGFEEMGVPLKKDEVLEKVLDDQRSYGSEEQRIEHIKDIREVYLEIRRLLQDVHLDIPKKQKIGDTELFTQT